MHYEMKESLEWTLTPLPNDKVQMIHNQTNEHHETFFMFFGYYDRITEKFIWRNNIIKERIKQFILNNYNIIEYLGVDSCFTREIFSDSVHIKEDDHVIIPTFIRMFHGGLRLVRRITDNDENKMFYYALIRYNFRDYTKFDKFMHGLTLYKNLLFIYMNPNIPIYQDDEENSQNIINITAQDITNSL